MLTTVLGLAMTVSAAQQTVTPTSSNSQVIYAVGGLARFEDNDRRLIVENERRDQIQRWRQVVINQRFELADKLDRLIASGDCEAARDLAVRGRYADIREAVTKTCDARESPVPR